MRRYILISGIGFIGLFILILIYLSIFGIKTNQFNDLINERIRDIDQKLSLQMQDVYLKLNLSKKNIKINTKNAKVYVENEFIELSSININLDLIKFIKNNNSIKNIEINTKDNSLKKLTNFINKYKFSIPRLLLFKQIEGGRVEASLSLYFNQGKQNDFKYEINGKIKNTNINLFENNISKINFEFNIQDKIFNFNNINFNYDNVLFKSNKLKIINFGKNFEVEGNIHNKKGLINLNSISKLLNLNTDFLDKKKIILESENNFSFKIYDKKIIKDLNYKSNLNFEKIFINKKYQNLIYLKNGEINTEYSNKKLNIKIDSDYSFLKDEYNNQEDIKNILINIDKNGNDEIIVKTILKDNKNKINSKEFIDYLPIGRKYIKDQEIKFTNDSIISFKIDKSNEINNLKINSKLNIENFKVNYKSSRIKRSFPNYKNEIFLKNNKLEFEYSKNKALIKSKGQYSIDDKKFDNFEININDKKEKLDFETYLEINKNSFNIQELDYKKKTNVNSKLKIKGDYKKDDRFKFKYIFYSDKKNNINISNLNLSKNLKIITFDTIKFKFSNKDNKFNDLKIYKNNNSYFLEGKYFDGSSLVKNQLRGNSNNVFLKIFKNLNSEIKISLDKLYTGNQSYLENIKGKIIIKNNKIDAGNINAVLNKKNKFSLNIKTSPNSEKNTILYIEKPEPFIKNYKFIKGFKEGSLSYESIEKDGLSKSSLKIYDFKVKEVPVLAKILTLASLQGIADLLTGEGIRFKEFEMDYESKNRLTTINEIYAIGPAISLMMEGYIEKNKLTSLRGTLVPATTINKTISKIPLVGNILVGKKIGEGVFGVSFKIKGPPKNLKTTVNPIKTLTPRFITRTLEKIKKN
tara:strand:+ start:16244 stop:18832 length:2589 start_codon:yes stop_codon:yes gene_type:complete